MALVSKSSEQLKLIDANPPRRLVFNAFVFGFSLQQAGGRLFSSTAPACSTPNLYLASSVRCREALQALNSSGLPASPKSSRDRSSGYLRRGLIRKMTGTGKRPVEVLQHLAPRNWEWNFIVGALNRSQMGPWVVCKTPFTSLAERKQVKAAGAAGGNDPVISKVHHHMLRNLTNHQRRDIRAEDLWSKEKGENGYYIHPDSTRERYINSYTNIRPCPRFSPDKNINPYTEDQTDFTAYNLNSRSSRSLRQIRLAWLFLLVGIIEFHAYLSDLPKPSRDGISICYE